MSCGSHSARTCSECHPTNRHYCNGDCAWHVNQCVPKGAKKHLHTYFDRSQSSFYFIPQGSTVRDPPASLVKDQAFYVFSSSRNPSLKYVLSGQCGPFTSKDQLGPFFVVSVLLVLVFNKFFFSQNLMLTLQLSLFSQMARKR